jgi:ubiquinone biosynthesis protein
MKIDTIPQLARDTKRFHEIVSIFVKYGLTPWLRNIQAGWIQKHFHTAGQQEIGELSHGVRLRLAFIELGTTFIKLGQILSTRSDLVGPEVSAELSQLQSGTPPDLPDLVRETFKTELGAAPEDLFLGFDDQAAASASIGQVHFATLKDGTQVVVKVQHQGIEDKITCDLDIIKGLGELAEKHWEQARQYRVADTLAEFSRTLLSELDFTREKRNLDRFRSNFKKQDGIFIPKPYGDLSSKRVLTMDRLDGISLSRAEKLVAKGYDLSGLAQSGANIFLEMIFRDGFYHADPHPGNIFAMENSAIGLLDCGMVGRIDEKLREHFENLLMAVAENDTLALGDSICELGSVPREFSAGELRSELGDFLAEYGLQNLDEFDLGGAMNRMMEIIRKFNIILPSRVSLLIKVLVMLEGTVRELSPKFNFIQILKPYQTRIFRSRMAPDRLLKKARRNFMDWNRLIEMAPREMADILSQLKRGKFDVNLEHRKLDSVVNRMVMGILSAALFVGSSLILSLKVPPIFHGVSVPGTLGCSCAVFMGCLLVREILRSGNTPKK